MEPSQSKDILDDTEIKVSFNEEESKSTPGRIYVANENNIFGIYDDELENILKKVNTIVPISDFSIFTTSKDILEQFYYYEHEITDYLKNLKRLKNAQKELVVTLISDILEQKFEDKSNVHCQMIKNKIQEYYEIIVTKHINSKTLAPIFDSQTAPKSEKDTDLVDMNATQPAFKEAKILVLSQYISYLTAAFHTDMIPHFLLKSYKNKIKLKIKSICNPLLIDHYLKYVEYKPEVRQLKHFFALFVEGKLNIFDFQVLGSKVAQLAFDIFILSNGEFLCTDNYAKDIFIKKFPEYYVIFNCDKINCKADEDINEEYSINLLLEKTLSGKVEITAQERHDMLSLSFDSLNTLLENSHEKLFLLLFSYSFVFNSIVKVDIKQKRLCLNGEFQCNSRERQFLTNILQAFRSHYDSLFNYFTINSYAQSLVIKKLLVANSSHLFNDSLNLKEKLTSGKIFKLLSQTENEKIKEETKEFLKKYASETGIKYIFSQFFGENKSNENKIKVNIDPFDHFFMSTSVTICISGFGSAEDDMDRQWENLTVDLCKLSDFYFYNWPAESVNSIIGHVAWQVGQCAVHAALENYTMLGHDILSAVVSKNQIFLKAKENASICGKLLAYILASRTVYKFQTINLIGFSLGTHVIKHCIKELSNHCDNDQSLANMIQNIVLIGGATQLKHVDQWKQRFDNLVSGRVINCYGNNDSILKYLYRMATWNTPIGISPIPLSGKVENWDFSDLKIGHLGYRKILDVILKRINFLNQA